MKNLENLVKKEVLKHLTWTDKIKIALIYVTKGKNAAAKEAMKRATKNAVKFE